MEHPALLIIDMQNDFVREGALLRVVQAENVIPKIQDVLGAFRAKNLPVFHILRIHRNNGSDVEITRKDLFSRHPFAVAGSPGAREIDELKPLPGEYVIEKIRMSAFIGTELDLMLRTLGITGLVVTGVQTPNCIRTTVFDAIAYNYPVILVDDATGAQSEEIHQANVRDMANIGVRIMDARTLIDTPG
ncbi:cysteine hydrolase family protein [Methanoregula sp.]|uniref:cysteine hydrolase family protein n=1 Tax=Methanoregula sp. TaxID=2052170 RepID=UPI003BAEE7D1